MQVHASDESVCAILANRVQPDVLQQGPSSQLFMQFQQLVSDQKYAEWGSASSSSGSFNGTLSVPQYVDLAIGDNQSSDASNWGRRRSQFLSMNYQEVSSSFKSSSRLTRMSQAALHEISHCAIQIASLNANGFVALLDLTNDERTAFAVSLTYKTGGNPNWSLTQFSAQPHDPGFTCIGGLEKASIERPIKLDALSQIINCSKTGNKSLILAVATTAGAAKPIALYSVDEEIQKLREDVTSQIQSLNIQVQKVAPSESVSAFALKTCPMGWSPYQPAAGRFVRGVDATHSLESLEEDAFQGHTFGDSSDRGPLLFRWSPTLYIIEATNGAVPKYSAGLWPDRDMSAGTRATNAKIVSDGPNGPPRVANETRPKNVSLLYCKKD